MTIALIIVVVYVGLSVASKAFMDSVKVAYEPDWHDADSVYHLVEVCTGCFTVLSSH